MTVPPESSGPFDLITGLPVHVFITHAVVVLLPLAVLLLILVVTVPRLRAHYRVPAVVLALGAAISAFIAEQSGKALQARVGYPGEHAEWGEMVTPAAVALAVLSVIWLILSRMASSRGKVLAGLIGVGVIVAGIIAVVFTVLAGHSGAEETWSDRMEGSETSMEQSAPATTESEDTEGQEPEAEEPVEPAPAEPSSDVLSLELVALNNSEASCWAVIDGSVYDLTDWISSHPGGASRILGLCGSDGTSQFQGQHQGSSSAQGTLERYRLGALGDPAP
jgi:cytochrome b involved in lipid metabolism